MKEKIIEQLRAQYANYSLGEKALNSLAEFAANSVETEEDIEAVIKSLNGLAKGFQGESDSIRTAKSIAEKRVAELEAILSTTPKPTETIEKPSETDFEARMQALIDERVKAINTELETFKNRDAQAKREAFIIAKAKELGIPEYRMNEGIYIPSEADETEITEKLSTIAQNIKTNSLPIGGNPITAQIKVEASQESAKRMFKDLNR